MTKTLIDGDIVAYRIAFSCKDAPETYKFHTEALINFILDECSFYNGTGDYEIYLTGKGNFRHEIAKSHEYKGNRKKAEKPVLLPDIREYLINRYRTTVSEGQEADDLIGIEATRVGPNVVIASGDKDMLQLPATHFNFNKNIFKFVDEVKGIRFFYTQILTGDAADNIKGLHRVGPVKAEKILKGISCEDDLWKAVLNAYGNDRERAIENARLLWLRRYEGEIWEPPDQRNLKED